MRILACLAVILSFTSTARADVFELDFYVDSGGFMGYWRFADGPEGNTIGEYSCNKDIANQNIVERDVRWFHRDCVVTILPTSENTAQAATFEILAMHAITKINISGSNRIAFHKDQPVTPTISLAPHDTGGVVTIHTTNITVEPSGFPGLCTFEYILDEMGLGRNSCDGQSTTLPLGTAVQLFAAGRDANPVHISHMGIPYPEGNGRVYRANNTTVAFRTVDVSIAPVAGGKWHIEGVTPAGTWMTDTHAPPCAK